MRMKGRIVGFFRRRLIGRRNYTRFLRFYSHLNAEYKTINWCASSAVLITEVINFFPSHRFVYVPDSHSRRWWCNWRTNVKFDITYFKDEISTIWILHKSGRRNEGIFFNDRKGEGGKFESVNEENRFVKNVILCQRMVFVRSWVRYMKWIIENWVITFVNGKIRESKYWREFWSRLRRSLVEFLIFLWIYCYCYRYPSSFMRTERWKIWNIWTGFFGFGLARCWRIKQPIVFLRLLAQFGEIVAEKHRISQFWGKVIFRTSQLDLDSWTVSSLRDKIFNAQPKEINFKMPVV